MPETQSRPATLADLLAQKGHIPEAQVVPLFVQILKDLAFSHSQAQIHLDVKPSKIVRSPDGSYALTDYGMSRIGTPRYMSPERAQHKHVDARSDIYSLGVVLFEAATGRLPFEGELNYEIIDGHINKTPPFPRAIRPEISGELQRAILTSLAKDPKDRFQSAREFQEVLERISLKREAPQPPPRVPGAASPTKPTVTSPSTLPTEEKKPAPKPSTTPTEAVAEPPRQLREIQEKAPTGPAPDAKKDVGAAEVRKPAKTEAAAPANPPEREHARSESPTARPAAEQKPVIAAVPDRRARRESARRRRKQEKEQRRQAEASSVRPARTEPPKPEPSVVGSATAQLKPVARPLPKKPAPRRKVGIYAGLAGAAAVIVAVLIVIAVSGGSRVPNLRGTPRDAAGRALNRAGLRLTVVGERDDTLPAGTIVGQDPAPRTRAEKGQEVRVYVSSGKVGVPDLSGKNLEVAVRELSSVSLSPGRLDTTYSDSSSPGTIISTSPAAAVRVDRGSAVVLSVAGGRATCPQCGASREPRARFCTACGYKFQL